VVSEKNDNVPTRRELDELIRGRAPDPSLKSFANWQRTQQKPDPMGPGSQTTSDK
jgi:hypothetical protein